MERSVIRFCRLDPVLPKRITLDRHGPGWRRSSPASLPKPNLVLLQFDTFSPSQAPSHIGRQTKDNMETASDIILTNIETLPGRRIVEHYGMVQGSTIRAKHVGRDLMAGLKNFVGGELKGYTELLRESRAQATNRMVEQARELGANAIVNVRYTTSSVAGGASEILAYGTAVKVA